MRPCLLLLVTTAAVCLHAKEAGTCEEPRGKTYVHSARAYRVVSKDTFEITSVHTHWDFSPYLLRDSVHVTISANTLRMFGDDRRKDERLTDHIWKTDIGYSINPESCEVTFSTFWFGQWLRYRYGDDGGFDEAPTEEVVTRQYVHGELQKMSVIGNPENEFLLNVYNALKPNGGEMTSFVVRAIRGAIQIGVDGEIRAVEVRSKSLVDLWGLNHRFRVGVEEGYVDRHAVRVMLKDRKFAVKPMFEKSISKCDAFVETGKEYLYEDRRLRNTANGKVEMVSIHMSWTTHALTPEVMSVEILRNRIMMGTDGIRIRSKTEYVSKESVVVDVNDQTCEITVSSINDWEVSSFTVIGESKVVRSMFGASISVEGETVDKDKLRGGLSAYLMKVLNYGREEDSKIGSVGMRIVGSGILVGSVMLLQPTSRAARRTPLLEIREQYRYGLDVDLIDGQRIDSVAREISTEPMAEVADTSVVETELPTGSIEEADVDIPENIPPKLDEQVGSSSVYVGLLGSSASSLLPLVPNTERLGSELAESEGSVEGRAGKVAEVAGKEVSGVKRRKHRFFKAKSAKAGVESSRKVWPVKDKEGKSETVVEIVGAKAELGSTTATPLRRAVNLSVSIGSVVARIIRSIRSL